MLTDLGACPLAKLYYSSETALFLVVIPLKYRSQQLLWKMISLSTDSLECMSKDGDFPFSFVLVYRHDVAECLVLCRM